MYQLLIYPIEIILQVFFGIFLRLTDNIGLAIIGLSICINFLVLPLYNIAERQERVEKTAQKRMEPKRNKIKTVFKGDEQYMILTAYYRQQHYHPIFALRGAISLLIQIPFFIAAYHFLSNLSILQGASFPGIADLGKPDALINIGSISVNILPFVMTIINIISGAIYTKEATNKEKVQLYGTALLFLILLYKSPSGLVFYWTLNNIFSLAKNIIKSKKNPAKILYFIAIICALGVAFYVVFFTDKSLLKKIFILIIMASICSIPLIIYSINLIINFFLSQLNKQSKIRTQIFFFCIFGLFILTGMFIPSSLIVTSPQEFSFIDNYTSPLELLVFPLLQSAGVFLIWLPLVYFLFSDKTKNMVTYLTVIYFLSSLINTFIFKGNYGTMLQNLYFSTEISKQINIVRLLTDIGFFLSIAIILLFIFKYNFFRPLRLISAIITVSLILPALYNYTEIQKAYKIYDTEIHRTEDVSEQIKPVFHLSKTKNNIIVLMLDRAISSFIPLIFEELPETAEQFKGFTWYPNTVTFNGHTIMAAPPLYGGYEYVPDKINARENEALVDKHNEALCVMPKIFSDHGFAVTFTDASWANYSWVPDNRIFTPLNNVHAENLIGKYKKLWIKDMPAVTSKIIQRNLFLFSLFRTTVPSLRGKLYDEGNWWNPNIIDSLLDYLIDSYSELDYLSELTTFDSNKNTFSCIVNEFTHGSFYLQYPEYFPTTYVTNTGTNNFDNVMQHKTYHVNAAALKLVGEWLAYLKRNGAYDNTRIIIVSDHGMEEQFPAFKNFPQMGKLFPGHANALLMVKDFNADFPVKTDMTFMTTADVPALAVDKIIENPVNPYTKNPITTKDKNDGAIYHVTHRWTPGAHKTNTFILDDEEWHVKDNIFDPENWRQIK